MPSDEPGRRAHCPGCYKTGSLYENVEVSGVGWRDLDDQLVKKGSVQEIEWDDPLGGPTGEVGCGACGWEGSKKDVEWVHRGIDGVPIADPIPGQLTIDERSQR
jgi:hypothetical protein